MVDVWPDDVRIIREYLLYLKWRESSPNTRDNYRGNLRRLAGWLRRHRDTDLLHATPEDLLAWRDSLAGLAINTVLTYATPARGFYHWARRMGLRNDDPSEDLPLPRVRRGLPRPIPEAELEFAIDAALFRIRPWLILAAYAGLRAGEIAHLQRNELLNTADPPVIVLAGKGGHWRIIPMIDYVWTELIISGVPRHGHLFGRMDGRPGPNTPNLVSKLTNTHLRDCGFDHTFHSLRHRFGTQAQKAIRDLQVVADMMGHASMDTTRLYAAYDLQDAARALTAIQPKSRLRAIRKPH